MATVLLACEAMATRFELVLHGDHEASVRGAGEEALAEIHRIDAALSFYRPDSQIAAINRDASRTPVRVTPEVFQLIEHALHLSHATQGAFDITVAPLLRVWAILRGSGRLPEASALAEARQCVGTGMVELDPENFRVGLRRPGAMLDMGAIGKGYALDRAAELLRETGITQALIHGGTSTVVAIGNPPDAPAWKIAIARPPIAQPPNTAASMNQSEPEQPIAVVDLSNESLSVSAVWGKGFEVNGRFYGHILDPALGEPVSGMLLSAVVLPLATESDALSTALLVRGPRMLEALSRGDSSPRCLVMESAANRLGYRVISNGISINDV